MSTPPAGSATTRRIAKFQSPRLFVRAAAALLATAALLVVPTLTPASAGSLDLTKVRVTAISDSFTVSLAPLGRGWRYRLYASTNKPDVYFSNLRSAPHRSAPSSKPTLTVSHLGYTSAPYWYRVQALMGSRHHTSAIFSVGLRPLTPTGLKPSTVGGVISLKWSGTSSGFTLQQAGNPSFSGSVRSYGVRGGANQLTPYGLRPGAAYWYRVRGLNNGTASAYSKPVEATAGPSGRPVRAMTYNILTLDADGSRPAGGETVARWSERRLAAARYIRSAAPDVIGLQEGATWVGAPRGPRQVDSLVSALGGAYTLATTEVSPNQPHYFRTGVYVLYKNASYAPVGAGGHWDLGTMPGGGSRWAAYQLLRQRASGATFLFVSSHLYVGAGKTGDVVRRNETTTMIRKAQGFAASHHVKAVVYAGDFNSHERHALDGPAVAMRASHVADALHVAQSRTNQKFNSANQYRRTAMASGLTLDHIYTSPGVAVPAWRQILKLSGGRFVGVIPSDHNPVVADLLIPE